MCPNGRGSLFESEVSSGGPPDGLCTAGEGGDPTTTDVGTKAAGVALIEQSRRPRQLELPFLGRTQLWVRLFGPIPDAAKDSCESLLMRIKREFEAQNPSVELCFTKWLPGDDQYAVDQIEKYLSAPISEGGVHILEIDTVLLEMLVRRGLVQAWAPGLNSSDWHPAGREAVTIDSRTYGVPHWLCIYVIYSRQREIAEAADISELMSMCSQGRAIRLAGKTWGRWSSPMLYCGAHDGVHGPDCLGEALHGALDARALHALQSLTEACQNNGHPETTPSGGSGARAFVSRQRDALIGFAESLHALRCLTGAEAEFYVTPLIFAKGRPPRVAVDAFVLRADCSPEIEAAARAFVEFLNRPETMRSIMMSEDAGSQAVPRYLLPASLASFGDPVVQTDRYYRRFEPMIATARPYPNVGFYDFATQTFPQFAPGSVERPDICETLNVHRRPAAPEGSPDSDFRERRKA